MPPLLRQSGYAKAKAAAEGFPDLNMAPFSGREEPKKKAASKAAAPTVGSHQSIKYQIYNQKSE
jgi:hypothetical protein